MINKMEHEHLILKDIVTWVESSKNLEVDYLNTQKRVNVKFLVEPWYYLKIDDSPVLPQ